ncbi:hypothetical protein VTI28DRAFT_3807 [Corynascus sepedonium]
MPDLIKVRAEIQTAAVGEATRLIIPRWTLFSRIKYFIFAYFWKALSKLELYHSELKRIFSSPGENEPDKIKSYPVRKFLKIRIFFPPSYDPAACSHGKTAQTKLPTLLTCHGGGFMVGEARDNDAWNRTFAKRHGFLVVALDYTKTPRAPFPTALRDIEALVGCVLSDPSLPVDTTRVAVTGWSAGGNLVLAATQLPSLRGRIRAAIPFYPLVDFVPGYEAKAKGRRYKPTLGGFRSNENDFLLRMIGLFDWGYLHPGQRCDDPLLSPYYASPGDLPPNIFLIGCELDMLAHEAWRMACKLAGKKVPALDEAVGREGVAGKGELITEGDERFAWEETTENGSRYRWLLVPDMVHGFDHGTIEGIAKDPVMMEDARIKTAKVIDLIGEWLLSGPLKAES